MKAVKEVTEELKAPNQLEWVGRMNNIRNWAEEIIRRYFQCIANIDKYGQLGTFVTPPICRR